MKWEQLGIKETQVIADNKKRINEIKSQIIFLNSSGTDTAGWHRRELNNDLRFFQKENNDIIKGWIKY